MHIIPDHTVLTIKHAHHLKMAGVVVSIRTAATSHMTQHNVLIVLKMYFQKTDSQKSLAGKRHNNELQTNVYTYSILHSLSLHKGHINHLGNTSAIVQKSSLSHVFTLHTSETLITFVPSATKIFVRMELDIATDIPFFILKKPYTVTHSGNEIERVKTKLNSVV
jgi:hypothetical protein